MAEIKGKGVNMFGTEDGSPMTVRQLIEALEWYARDCEEDGDDNPGVVVYIRDDGPRFVTGYQFECFTGMLGRPCIWLDIDEKKA